MDELKYKRPTTAVRNRPYIFRYQTRSYTLIPGVVNPPQYFEPEGNVADGNRVTWGWWIRVIKLAGVKCTVEINGLNLVIDQNVTEFTLVDTTKNSAGIDASTYVIRVSEQSDAVQIYAIEQILQIASL